MKSSTPTEIDLTDDLVDFIRKSTIQVVWNRLPSYVDVNDIVQHVLLCIVSRPPKFDPSRGAKLKTLLYVIIQRQASKYLASTVRRGPALAAPLWSGVHFDAELDFDQPSFIDYIDCDETRSMCRLMLEHDNNLSEVARRMGITEGTIRYRLQMLQSKLRAAGFDPFGGETT